MKNKANKKVLYLYYFSIAILGILFYYNAWLCKNYWSRRIMVTLLENIERMGLCRFYF